MPKDIILDTRVDASAGKPVEIPGGDFAANAQMTRSGLDLHLTSPDGHSVVVSGYFAQDTQPDLVSADGSRLTPHLVQAFLPPEHPGQYAASGQTANDVSPVGKITGAAGGAQITHTDGTHATAAIGMPVYQGDIVETSKTGAVNITFADHTAFAVGENARIAIDKYNYDSEHQSGNSLFSVLQGVFVYTSGLIGGSDPGNVGVETPVGTIGIRGTAFVGTIFGAGHKNTIAIWDGAGFVSNAAGISEMNHKFKTISLVDYNQPATTLSDMNPKTFIDEHKTMFSLVDAPWFDDLLKNPNGPHQTPHHLNDHGMLQPRLPGGDGKDTAWTHSDDSSTSTSSFAWLNHNMTDDAGFLTGYLGSSSSGPVSPVSPPQPGPGPNVIVPLDLTFSLAANYTESFIGTFIGVREFAAADTILGTPDATNPTGLVTYTVSSPDAPDAFSISGGHLVVNDPLLLQHFLYPSGIDITITGTDAANRIGTVTQHLDLRDFMPSVQATVTDAAIVGTGGADFIYNYGDNSIQLGDGHIIGNGGADVLIGGGGDNMIRINDNTFKLVDGGAGTDTLQLTGNNWDLDFTAVAGTTLGFENLSLGESSNLTIKLSLDTVFSMTDPTSLTLDVSATTSQTDSLIVDTGGGEFSITSGALGSGDVTYTGTVGADTVSLVIHQGTIATPGYIAVSEA